MHVQTPPLVLIGGLSGAGKSTLAGRLAADSGAVWLRSDAIRKELWGVEPLTKLPPEAYSRAFSTKTYDELGNRTVDALNAGLHVVVDMGFIRPTERALFVQYAADCGVVCVGFWLDAAPDVLCARVDARVGDVSDADSAIVNMQLGFDLGLVDWVRLDANQSADDVYRAASGVLARGVSPNLQKTVRNQSSGPKL